jgi:dienelactone hydrolase
MRIKLVIAAVFLTAQTAFAAPLKEHFAVETNYNGQQSKVSVHTVFPDIGLDKYPVMFIVHGSGGQSHSRELWYAQKLAELGVWSVITDHFRYRGVESTAYDQAAVNTDNMVYDVFKVLDRIAENPKVDMSRVGIMGFSKGGSTSLHTAIPSVIKQYSEKGHRFALHIPLYPGCTNQYFDTNAPAPIYMLLGGKDDYADPNVCLSYANKFEAKGSKIKTIVYPEGLHAWDSTKEEVIYDRRIQNYAKCVMEQQADGSWKESLTGLTVMSAGMGLNPRANIPANMGRAMSACRTYGAHYGGNADVKYDALWDIKKIVEAEFNLAQ